MTTCEDLSPEGKAFFTNIEKHFTDAKLRKQGYYNVMWNFMTIKDDIEQGISSLEKGTQETDFIVAGAKFGDVISIFVNGAKKSSF